MSELLLKLRPWVPVLRPRHKGTPPASVYDRPGTGSTVAISIGSTIAILVLWWVAARYRWVAPLFLPSPETVIKTFGQLTVQTVTGGTLLEHSFASLSRVLVAFVAASLTAIPLGLVMGVNRHLRGLFDPVIEFYRPLPPLAYLPLTVIWFGIGELQKTILLYLAIFAPLALSARGGVRSVSIEQLHAAYSMGGNRRQVLLQVVLPAALPDILIGMRIGLGFGWTTLVAAEMVAASQGLGQLVLNASGFLRTDIMFVGIAVIGAIAYLFDLAVRQAERRLVPWKGRT